MLKYDVVVCGGGFAGSAAALSAAREGAKVLLIEQNNCLGGAAAECLVNPFMPYWTKDENGQRIYLSKGIFSEICDEICKLDAQMSGKEYIKTEVPLKTFNEEYLKLVLQRMLLYAGVKLLFHTSCVGVKKSGDAIKAVTVSNKDGIYDIEAECFIDATGDADVAAMSGCPVRVGREADGLCQPMTLCFRVSNIDIPRFNAVKNDEPKMAIPVKRKAKEQYIKAVFVISKRSGL